jgi:hypothetical protein
MGDLTDLQSADAVKVVGCTSTGLETNPLAVDLNGNVTANQGLANTTANAWPTKLTDGTDTANVTATLDLQTDDRINTSGLDAVVALTVTPVEAKVGASALVERKYLILEGLSINIKWGFSNTTQSFDLFKNQMLMIPVGPNVHVWLKTTTGTGSAGVGEGS